MSYEAHPFFWVPISEIPGPHATKCAQIRPRLSVTAGWGGGGGGTITKRKQTETVQVAKLQFLGKWGATNSPIHEWRILSSKGKHPEVPTGMLSQPLWQPPKECWAMVREHKT